MTATMAAKDTNQLTRTNANLTGTNTNGHHPIRRQPFYTQPSALVNTTPTAITTTAQTTMGRAINIGFAGYTHANTESQHAGDAGIMHERVHQRNEVARPTRVAVCVDIAVVDDDEANVDSNGHAFTRRDRVAAAAAAAGGDVNFAVDTRTGVTTGDNMLDAADDDVDDDASDSFGSMETLSDNVAVWVDGEKHWVAGVDANTTCADLIGALLNYQNAQQLQEKHYHQQQQQQPQQHMFNVNSGKNNNNHVVGTTSSSNGSNGMVNTAINQSTLIKTSTHTKENCDPLLAASGELTIGGCLAMAAAVPALKMALTVPATGGGAPLCGNRLVHAAEYVIVKQHRHCEEYLDGNAKVFDVMPVQDGPSRKECELLLRRLTAGNGNNGTFTALPNALHRASSPSLNLNTQVSSLLSTDKDSGMGSPVGSSRSARLRRRKYKSAATVSWLAQANTLHPRVSQRAVAAFSGLGNALSNAPASNGVGQHFAVSDCGMGEEDDVTAEALDGLGRGGDGGEGGGSANERLLKIILAQDETIHRQLALLREKERQISKIEEEKHRVRERELGKNYLLETYLNGLDEAHGELDLEACTDVALADSPLNEFNDVRVADAGIVHYGAGVGGGAADDDGRDDDADVEIYIDEPFQRTARTIGAATTTTAAKKVIGTSKATDFNLDARHSKKLKGDFGGAGEGGTAVAGGKIETNKQPAVSCQDNEKDVEAQLVWLEKIYTLNKQLQREEEMLLKLHAKIRKHQVKRAYQTKREVLQQIEKLDAELTLQCCDIRAVESKLHASNEQLKQKLGVLERLSQEFLQTMETPTAGDVLHPDADDATVAAANRMPDVINNDDHILATMLPATEVARTRESQVADVALPAKQMADGLAAQGSCQSQQCGGTQDAVWHFQDESMDLPQTVHATAAHCNKIKELCELTQTNTMSMTTTQIQSTTEKAIATTTTTNALTLKHATTLVSKLTATSCTTAPSSLSSSAQTMAATTTTQAASTAEAAAFACNMPAMSPADEKQTTALHLLQPQHLQQQQQQQEQQQRLQQKQLPAATEGGNNSHQRVAADDVLVDALAAGGGAALPQSNYPISCINQAAIHATSKQPTQHGVVAAANFTVPEQALPTATATLPAAYLTSATAQSAGNTTILQQQQNQPVQKQHAQLLPQRQYLSYMSAGCVSSNSNDISCNNNTSNKNLLPPSHAAHTKTLQKQMFGPKSLNQRPPTAAPPPPKTIHTSAAAWTTPPAPMATPMHAAAHTGFSMPSILVPPRPTTPTTLSAAPVVPPVVDITQLGTLV